MVSVTAPNKNTGSPPARQGICVLGATGSIGRSTLDVIARHPERYQVVALAANSRVKELAELAASSGAKYVALGDAGHQRQLRDELARLGVTPKVLIGPAGVAESAALDEVDTVMAAIVGAAGLKATLDAARHGKRVLLANKEALVMAGAIFMEIVRSNRAELLPIDSEHNAIFQCLPANGASISPRGVKKIILTASGGPFRGQPREALREVTPDQACAHPTWRMGRKISVDSATMMNKGLEIIEAHWLFDVPKNDIEVVIHPQSVIHSMVEYLDGSVIAQLGNPDMRTPIAQALAFPERIEAGVKSLNLMDIGALTFENPDMSAFPALSLAYEALHLGGCAPAVLNAANEIAVDAFLSGGLRFLDITTVIEKTMNLAPATRLECLDDVLAVDEWARRLAGEQVATLRGAL